METENWNTALDRNYEVTRQDLLKNKVLAHGAWLSPILVPLIPALILFIVGLFINPIFFSALAFVWLIGGFFLGLILSGGMLIYRQRWLSQMRERIAVDGIKTEEVEWFKHELTGTERKALKEIEAQNRLLGDAYRETLATRLTSTRIIKSAKKELSLNQKQQNKLKYVKAENTEKFQAELKKDFDKLTGIKNEAEQMKIEAENRLHQIEMASRHGSNFSETELTLKKLSTRANELPLALEAMKMEDEIRQELEAAEDEVADNAK
jgi:hypothetical protein